MRQNSQTIENRYFTRFRNNQINEESRINKFLNDLNLIKVDTVKKPNFAIIPFICDGHISALLIDLKEPLPQSYTKRIYSFDSPTYHTNKRNILTEQHEMFGIFNKNILNFEGNIPNSYLDSKSISNIGFSIIKYIICM